MHKPCLRPLDFQPVNYQGQQMWLLRDPLKLSDMQLIVPGMMAQMLAFCDGTRSPQEIHSAFCLLSGTSVDFQVITEALEQLDAAYLLDNPRSQKVREKLLQDYRSKPFRSPSLADAGYPGNPQDLTPFLEEFGAGDSLSSGLVWNGRGIVSPHIDYPRGGHVYSKVWQRTAEAIKEVDLVIIFGTDHNGEAGTITLTRQPYATPYGILPPDLEIVESLARVIGHEAAFADELHHREEHSIELSAVWLHHMYQLTGTTPKPMVPILVGSFYHHLNNGSNPHADPKINGIIETLRQATAGRRVLAVASVDLAHVGPNFGDSFYMDSERCSTLAAEDMALMSKALHGDAIGWYEQIAAINDRNRICGFSPTYLLLRYLGPTQGHQVAYDQCPADNQNASFVSICGLLLD